MKFFAAYQTNLSKLTFSPNEPLCSQRNGLLMMETDDELYIRAKL